MTRRAWRAAVVGGVLLALVVPGGAAGGALVDPLPTVISARWVTMPVTAGQTEYLKVRAVDANDAVTEIVVQWGDGIVSFASLICRGRGRIPNARLDHQYSSPGLNVVQVVARSASRCSASEDQESLPFLRPTRVR
jgi:hypothetical protein